MFGEAHGRHITSSEVIVSRIKKKTLIDNCKFWKVSKFSYLEGFMVLPNERTIGPNVGIMIVVAIIVLAHV